VGKILPFRLTQRTVLRRAQREVKQMYALTEGGRDPVVSEESREAFEQGYLDEVVLQDWQAYCLSVLERL